MSIHRRRLSLFASLLFATVTATVTAAAQAQTLLNVSYDPTREFYGDFNRAFNQHWQAQGHDTVQIQQSHGGSGKQARSVSEGLRADVVTLALAGDIDQLHTSGKWLAKDWQQRLPHSSTPYTSTIVFLVRKGNPKQIQDWNDLVKPGISVITPNPKISGGARWNFLAAWAYAKQAFGSDQLAQAFVQRLFANVPVLDSGARAATNTFTNNGIGDVLLAWENEAYLSLQEHGTDVFEIITPSLSILAEPSVAVVDRNVDRKGTRAIAEAYLEYLYSDVGQRIAAQHFYRPRNPTIAKEFAAQFAPLKQVTIDAFFGGWQQAQTQFFSDGGVFDQIYQEQ
ncbi:MAG: sulfate ABC transporter substrate-binding protein [Pseudomonas sp.]|nr:sulfate ABC transporter substrate-binding protein [Pseudomonas sp.]